MLRPLGDFLSHAASRTGAKKSIDAAVIVEAAAPIILQIMPELRPADFQVVSYQRQQLTVAVANPAIGQEIRISAEAILDILVDTFPSHPITRLRIIPLVIPEDQLG